MKRFKILLLSIVIMTILTIPAFAYVDPSVTSFAIQGIIGIIVLVVIIAAIVIFIRRRR